ncbi:DUF3102 domain-containing protein [Paenibacillus polysaccharolyticus]|uniref:DUF3102 domain-containing protein n=1 Tax=Paenibacillus polysaccharolyticus TaxID=582692 RepID=UPI003009AEB4
MTTNELALSSDLPTLTAEINAYKRVAGEAIFEIGRRLKHVKEKDLVHGQWARWCSEDIGMDRAQADKFIRVAVELGDECTYTQIGLRALYEIATLPPEERTRGHTIPSTGATKTPDEMTVRELREVKAALKAERERAEKAESDYETVRDTLESMRDQPPQVEYVYVENADSDPLAVTGDVRINGNVQRLSEAVGEVLEEFGFFQYYDRQVQALSERSRDELTTVVTALERFTHSLKRALNASDADVIEI